LAAGPVEWVPAKLLEHLTHRFRSANIRAVLPDGASGLWNPLVMSLLDRTPPAWEFFPSQIAAITGGLLDRDESYALQMPTGAGKTALCETLLFAHLQRRLGDAAILLVPYRSLASELRTTLVRRLNAMGLRARCAYGGTVPTGDEVRGLEDTRAMVATPEALSGLMSADSAFLRRTSLVVVDEGHLLDGGARGVGLELLVARMKARDIGPPRFVFVSAIVPNIEEINAWLGGGPDCVIRSEYRPAVAEFAVLRPAGKGADARIALVMHPHEDVPMRFTIDEFLGPEDFRWTNQSTGRRRTYPFGSLKTQAIGAARKALPMGAAAVFAANKRGDQGAVGLAEELLSQLRQALSLPEPLSFARAARLGPVIEYLELEYGTDWIGTRTLAAGAVLHHGDIPQETREVLESLVRRADVKLAICTNTLAEGVNLPIRSLVLYSVERRGKEGRAESLLARDVKNLVGRAGRAGSTTKGLVLCVNPGQWPLVERVARQAVGEPVVGALRLLIGNLGRALARQNLTLDNRELEETPQLHTLVDGVDATLIDLAAEELGPEALVRLAVQLVDHTFAARHLDQPSRKLLETVFELRAQRIAGIRTAGRLGWLRETGARARMIDAVERGLLPRRPAWDDVTDPIDAAVVSAIVDWAWEQTDLQDAARDAYRVKDGADVGVTRLPFLGTVSLWLAGARFRDIAARANLPVDDVLGVHTRMITFVLQTLVEQGVALLAKLLAAQGRELSPAVRDFPEHLRFGVPNSAARILASAGMRHRRAAVELGAADELKTSAEPGTQAVIAMAERSLREGAGAWRARLGSLVYERTREDLATLSSTARGGAP
jgi:hypothetical protein